MHIFWNFKNFENAEINTFAPLTLLIGPNGSGKSNVIEGIELLSFIANGRPLHEITDVGRGLGGIEIRGGLEQCPRYGNFFFSLSFTAQIKFLGKNESMFYGVTIGTQPTPQIFSETLTVGKYKIFNTEIPSANSTTSSDLVVEYNNFSRGGKNPHASASANRSMLSQYHAFATRNKKLQSCTNLVHAISRYLRSSFVFDPDPKLMRTYVRIGNNILARNGNNISAVLYSLSIGSDEDKKKLDTLLEWIKELPDEPFQSFEFIVTPLNDVIFCLKNGNGYLTDARLLSDGTLRCLAVLTAIETAEEGSRVIIEEFDNGLHPSRVRILAQAIQDCCKRRKLNILVTTHNPATLNSLTKEQLDGVVLCVWDKKEKTSKLINLPNLPRYDVLLERGRLGDLITNQVIEKYFSDTDTDYKDKALEWLKEF